MYISLFPVELEFKSDVKAVRLRRDRIVVVLLSKVIVYTFAPQPQRLATFETCDNPGGLAALCSAAENKLLAFPGRMAGHVQLVDLASAVSTHSSTAVRSGQDRRPSTPQATTLSSSPMNLHTGHIPESSSVARVASSTSITSPHQEHTVTHTLQTSIIPAHTSPLSSLTLNQPGTMLATSSVKGTLIRIFDTQSGRITRELRRGADTAVIYSVAFSSDSRWLCCGSDKGTVHIYSLEVATPQPMQELDASMSSPSPSLANRQSSLAFMKDLLPKYFSSEWSFATCQVKHDAHFICTFGADMRSIIVITQEGSYYQFAFDPTGTGGECARELYHRFLGPNDEDEL